MTTKKDKKVSVKACFQTAYNLLKNGFIQGTNRKDSCGNYLEYNEKSSGKCKYCAAGAIERSLFINGNKSLSQEQEMRKRLAKTLNIQSFEIEQWNDDDQRTKKDVLDAFQKVVKSVTR